MNCSKDITERLLTAAYEFYDNGEGSVDSLYVEAREEIAALRRQLSAAVSGLEVIANNSPADDMDDTPSYAREILQDVKDCGSLLDLTPVAPGRTMETLQSFTFPPFAHAFTVPVGCLDFDFYAWVSNNCVVATKTHYSQLSKDARRYRQLWTLVSDASFSGIYPWRSGFDMDAALDKAEAE